MSSAIYQNLVSAAERRFPQKNTGLEEDSMLRFSSLASVVARRQLSTKVSASMVKELRQITGAPMMDCKKALEDPDVVGDLDKAMEWLRMKGHQSAAKKADREANEGLVGVCLGDNSGAIVQVSSETDFVARNDVFQQLVDELSKTAMAAELQGEIDVEGFLQNAIQSNSEQPVGEEVVHVGATVRENVGLHRVAKLCVDKGVVSSYVHNAICPGMGTAGAIVALETDADADAAALEEMGKKLAMHVVAAKPSYLTPELVPDEVVAKEKSLLKEELKDSGKPDDIIEKIITGRLGKFYSNICLMEQAHLIEEGNPKMGKALKAASKELGTNVRISGFHLFSIK